jgi:cyanosortase A-associated protein
MDNELETNLRDYQNNPPQKYKFRFRLLAVLVVSSLLILGRSLIDSNIGKPTPLVFPEQIELDQTSIKISTSQASEVINDPQEFYKKPKFLFGRRYQYLVDDIAVDLDLRYIVGTEGNIAEILNTLKNINTSEDGLSQKTILKEPTGHYLTFTHQGRAYLTACINSRGISTVTQEQFNDNASDRAMDRDVIISWLLGQKDLRDRRCLWTLMSTPITPNSDLKVTNEKLEKMWILWYEWWKPRFPEP